MIFYSLYKEKMNNAKERINQCIIEELEQWNIPRRQSRDVFQLWSNGRPYSGVNQLLLQIHKLKKGFKNNRWLTFSQIKALWGSVKKGEKWSLVSYFNHIVKDKDTDKEKLIPFLKVYHVFNMEQTTLSVEPELISQLDAEKYLRAKNIVDAFTSWPKITEWTCPVYYPTLDAIQIPDQANFKSLDDYYHVLLHELIHSTGHASRLDRKIVYDTDKYEYWVEELIAEMGAAYLSSEAWIEKGIIDNCKAYIQGWLWAIKEDKNLLIRASSKGRKAKEYVMTNGKEKVL